MGNEYHDELPEDLEAEIDRIRGVIHAEIGALADAVDLRARVEILKLDQVHGARQELDVADTQLPEAVRADNIRAREDLHDSIDALVDKLQLKAHVRYAAALHALRSERNRSRSDGESS